MEDAKHTSLFGTQADVQMNAGEAADLATSPVHPAYIQADRATRHRAALHKAGGPRDGARETQGKGGRGQHQHHHHHHHREGGRGGDGGASPGAGAEETASEGSGFHEFLRDLRHEWSRSRRASRKGTRSKSRGKAKSPRREEAVPRSKSAVPHLPMLSVGKSFHGKAPLSPPRSAEEERTSPRAPSSSARSTAASSEAPALLRDWSGEWDALRAEWSSTQQLIVRNAARVEAQVAQSQLDMRRSLRHALDKPQPLLRDDDTNEKLLVLTAQVQLLTRILIFLAVVVAVAVVLLIALSSSIWAAPSSIWTQPATQNP